jgi:hypothetical protein
MNVTWRTARSGLRHPFRENFSMFRIHDSRRGLVRGWSFAAAALLALALPGQSQALSPVSAGTAPAAKHIAGGATIEVRGGHGGHGGGGLGSKAGGGFHGGGGGFRGGAIHSGGGFRAGPVFRGGGGGYRYAAPAVGRHYFAPRRAYWHHRHHFRPRYYGYAPSYYYGPRRYCRVVWTYYGPRKICRYRPWHHHWRHHHRRHHRFHVYW